MKKALAIVLAALLALGLVACTGNTPASTPPAASGSTPAGSAPAGDTQILKVAAVETAYGPEIWTKIAEAFQAANPGVQVELTVDKNLEDVITPNMLAGEYPDVVHRAVGGEKAMTETLIKDNAIEDISDVLDMTVPGEDLTVREKIIPGFLDTSVTMPYGDGKTYLAPMFYGPCGLFYNSALLEEKGWEVPTTWDEMWALGDQAQAEGIALFSYPTTGYFDALFFALLFETGGPEFFERAMHYEEGIWDTPEAQQAFDIVERLAQYTEPSVPANANDENFTKNQQLLLDNQAIFGCNGSWLIGEMAEAPRADGFTWGFMALPAVTDGGDRYSYTFFEQAWIPAGAQNKDLAKQFIAYLYSDEAANIFYTNSPEGSPAVQPIVGSEDIVTGDNKVYYSIYETGAKAAMGGWAATEAVEGLDTRAVWFDPINSLVSGDKTRDEWVNDIKTASDRLREALIQN